MGSKKNKLDQDHGIRHYTPPKLSLPVTRRCMEPDDPTPPPRTAVSVPFQWEEAPGKPRQCHTRSQPEGRDVGVARALELPPRLLFSSSSETTVLDGPYVGRATSFTSSYRSSAESPIFGSSRWGGLRKDNRVDHEGSFDFSDGTSKVKITRVGRRGSFSSLSQGSSHLWASIYESFKQVVPWKKSSASKIDTI